MNDQESGDLRELLRSQATMIDELRARVAHLESAPVASPSSTPPITVADANGAISQTHASETSRRGFLRLAGVAAAGAAAVVAGNASPAAAANNDNIFQGSNTTGTTETKITNTTNSGGVSDIAAVRGVGGANSVGVWGEANGALAAGVEGATDSGYGVYGSASTTGYSIYAGGVSRIGMNPHLSGFGFPTTGGYAQGDIIRNTNGDLFVCVVAGTAGAAQFRKLAGPATAGSLHLASPASRIYWTANGDGAFANGTDRLLSAVSVVPLGTTAILVSLLAYAITSDGYLTAYKAGTSSPGTINAYWGNVAGTQISSTTVIPLSSSREYRLRLSASGAGQAQVAVDLLGYFA